MSLFSERLKKLREEKSVSRNELAEELNVSTQTIANYENGNREPNFDNLIKLADYFKVTTDYLIGRSDFRTWEEEIKIKKLQEKYNLIQSNDDIDNEHKKILDQIIINKIEPLFKNLIYFIKKHLPLKNIENPNLPFELNNNIKLLLDDMANLFEKLVEFSNMNSYIYALYPNLIELHLKNLPIPFDLRNKVNKISAMEEIPKINEYFLEEIQPLLSDIHEDLLEMLSFYNSNISENANDLFNFISNYFAGMSGKDMDLTKKIIEKSLNEDEDIPF